MNFFLAGRDTEAVCAADGTVTEADGWPTGEPSHAAAAATNAADAAITAKPHVHPITGNVFLSVMKVL